LIERVISTRDVALDEDTVFNGKHEDIMDNLMHSTLNEIAAWIRTVELPEQLPSKGESETTRFYKDDTVQEALAQEDYQSGYNQGRKTNYTYPTPPSMPPPVALLTQVLSGVQLRDS
jgi:hypothetical protein